MGQHDGGEEGGARRDVHGLRAGAQDEEEDSDGEGGGEGDKGEEYGGREVGEDHCLGCCK